MGFVKKLVMHGFKSFPRKTELKFTNGINVILGPNGSGKSNVSDALCFVLGRLSIKSMRATKAKNLIFLGTKAASPAKEASVEMVFDNSDKIFSIDKSEISIKRIVRKNGQSIYKINNETKTRQDILVLLAQAGVDPNGYNIILQGEIQNLVRMNTEERRKIIEEVSGISIYESRKQKSLKELNKTEEKLKEVAAILRERTAYLNNLEKERQQALRFKKLEQDVKRYKASIIFQDLTKKKKEIDRINSEIERHNNEIGKIRKTMISIQTENTNFEDKIKVINENIKKSTGFEQERLNQEIADIRADMAGLNVKLENYENRLSEIQRQKQNLKEKVLESEAEIKEFQSKSPTKVSSQKDLNKKQQELERLEQEKKRFYTTKSELKSIQEMLQDKESNLKNYKRESEFFLNQIEDLSKELFDKKTTPQKLNELKSALTNHQHTIEDINQKERELEKLIHTSEHEIKKLVNLKNDISKMDMCPLCKNKITTEHIKSIGNETKPKLEDLTNKIELSTKHLQKISKQRETLTKEIQTINSEISNRSSDLVKLQNIDDKKHQIKSVHEKLEKLKQEINSLQSRKKTLESGFDENSNIEQKCEILRIEIQEISIRNKENIDSEISFKQKELERSKITLKQLSRDEQDLTEDIQEISKDCEEKEEVLEEKRQQEEELSKKFKKMIEERDNFQRKTHTNELEISERQNSIHNIEQIINNLKIAKARFDAEHENLEIEMLGFQGIEIMKINRDTLIEKLAKGQEIISRIGHSVNLRSLEVYDSVKKEYDAIKDRAELVNKEKEGIMKIIHEIDIKKKKTFNRTLHELNELFSRNFAQLSTKGHVTLEVENKKDPFEGGVGILVKTGHGKYFDVTSLSGGEQTLVALSLIFAIQEYKPYCFYILDEIDAALDKRNSERLAGLLKKYMKKGQYIVITHNDEIITNATALYGISMHDGISKIVSLKI
jgi:chromosome segregation protein